MKKSFLQKHYPEVCLGMAVVWFSMMLLYPEGLHTKRPDCDHDASKLSSNATSANTQSNRVCLIPPS